MPHASPPPTTPPRVRSRGRRIALGGLIAAVVAVGALAVTIGPRLVGDLVERSAVAAFSAQPPDAAAGPPGTMVKTEALVSHPFEAEAWRIMYRTTGIDGEKVVATGVVIVPTGPSPENGRTVLAWGHPTTGTAQQCAPSVSLDPFLDVEGLRPLLDRGYAIVATDYVGMGTAGPASYLIGETAGHSILDAVRAAQTMPEAHAGDEVVLWGHSQGGQAVLFAAQEAEEYAPELQIEAVAVAAPAADLTALIGGHLDDVSGATIGSYAFEAYAEAYADRGARLDQVLTAPAQAILPQMNELCLLTHTAELHALAAPVVGAFFSADPVDIEPWASLLRENSAGATSFSAPLFVAQGADDTLVLPADTAEYVTQVRRLGMTVDEHVLADADHGSIAYLALPALSFWLDARGL